MNTAIRRKRYLRRRGRRSYKKRFPLVRNKFSGAVVPFKLELEAPIYMRVVQSLPTFVWGYSMDSLTTSFTRKLLDGNMSNLCFEKPQMRDKCNTYLYYSINGCKLEFTRSMNAAVATVYQVPPLFLDIAGSLSAQQEGQLDAEDITQSDTALQVQVLNSMNRPVSKYYPFNSSFTTFSGLNGLGKGVYLNTGTLPILNLLMGHQGHPSASTTPEPQNPIIIGIVTATVYMTFTKTIGLNNFA